MTLFVLHSVTGVTTFQFWPKAQQYSFNTENLVIYIVFLLVFGTYFYLKLFSCVILQTFLLFFCIIVYLTV